MIVGQGHGKKGCFLGTDIYGNVNESEIIILPVPFDKTSTYRKGSNRGPAALIEASRNMELYDIETQYEVYKRGIHVDRPILARSSKKMIDSTYKRTKELLSQGKFVVALGGEHTISYPSILAHAERFGAVTVLQLDAHADLQDAYENNPWSHASVMARVKEIPNVTKIVSVGIRSMSSEELKNEDPENTFYAHELDGDWVQKVLRKLKGKVYITFDLDAFDPSLMPSTGTPEPGGLMWNQTMQLLKAVSDKCDIVGFDVVELLPDTNPAPDFLAAKLVHKLLCYKFVSLKV